MSVQINSNYLENYSREYAHVVCGRFFSNRQFITGQEITQLSGSSQVNFFIIKILFELWQEELTKLKSSPYFDYRDIAVHEALTQFMNVLSRRIKVEKAHLEPMVKSAVSQAVWLAVDPVAFYQTEIKKVSAEKINEYLKENKKYYKWHSQVITFLIDKVGFGHDTDTYLKAISAHHQLIKDSLEPTETLLATLEGDLRFDLGQYLERGSGALHQEEEEDGSFFDQVEAGESSVRSVSDESHATIPTSPKAGSGQLDESGDGPLKVTKLKAQFVVESYTGMKGAVGVLSESLAINQRFMFAKELFGGDGELLRQALESIDEMDSFESAVGLVNTRYASKLNWDADSDAVQEFMHLVYRRHSS